MTQNIQEDRPTEVVDGVPASIRSCKSCLSNVCCEYRRTLFRAFTSFDKEFGDRVDIGIIHSEKYTCIDDIAKSCKDYKSPTTDVINGGR